MIHVALVALVVLTASTDTPLDPADLQGKYWKAVEVAGRPTPTQDPKREAHVEFLAGDRLAGSDGCNRIVAIYELDADRITFSQMLATQIACLDPSGIEEPFREALKRTVRLSLTEHRLELFDAAGTRVAAFVADGDASAPAPAPSPGLAGTSWQLVKFESGDETGLTPDDRAKYTIEFGDRGRLTARIDCNRGRGSWKSGGPNQIEFGALALTRAKCPAGSLHDQIVKQWRKIRSYVVRDGHLFLVLMADGGIYEFEPITNDTR